MNKRNIQWGILGTNLVIPFLLYSAAQSQNTMIAWLLLSILVFTMILSCIIR